MLKKKSLLVFVAGIFVAVGIALLAQPAHADVPWQWKVKCKGDFLVTFQWTLSGQPIQVIGPIPCVNQKIRVPDNKPHNANDVEVIAHLNHPVLSLDCKFDKNFPPTTLKRFRFGCFVGDPQEIKGEGRPALTTE